MEIDKNFIPFNQHIDIIDKLSPKEHKKLLKIIDKYGGLCELICNKVLIDDLLGKDFDVNLFRKSITVEKIDDKKIKNSHILDVYNAFTKFKAFAFDQYPANIFSKADQKKLLINRMRGKILARDIFEEGLKKIQEGTILKVEIFCKKKSSNISGHSLLIKKVSNNSYIFFDPDKGETRNLSVDNLHQEMNSQIKKNNANNIVFLNSDEFLKKIK